MRRTPPMDSGDKGVMRSIIWGNLVKAAIVQAGWDELGDQKTRNGRWICFCAAFASKLFFRRRHIILARIAPISRVLNLFFTPHCSIFRGPIEFCTLYPYHTLDLHFTLVDKLRIGAQQAPFDPYTSSAPGTSAAAGRFAGGQKAEIRKTSAGWGSKEVGLSRIVSRYRYSAMQNPMVLMD